MVWSYEGFHPQYRAGQIVYKHTKNTEYRDAVNRALDLVETLMKKTFSNAEEIRNYFVSNGEPLFSRGMSERLYSKFYAKRGGGEGVVSDLVTNTSNGLVSLLFGSNPQESSVHNVLFFLKEFETNGIPYLPFIPTALISSSIEIFVEFLLNTATDIEVLEPWVGLLPIPEAGAIGGLVGEIIKAILAFLAAAIAMSRQDFETSFEALLLSIPFAGLMIQRAYKSEEKITGKLKTKLTETLNSIPSLQQLVTAPPPKLFGGRRKTLRKKFKHRLRNKHKWKTVRHQ
jgi:hypothetical protein